MSQVCRTAFVRQKANLWRVKEQAWQTLLGSIRYDPAFAIVDSFTLPVCRFASAHRCQRFRGETAFGKYDVARQTFYSKRRRRRRYRLFPTSTPSPGRRAMQHAAIYVKEAAGYPEGENTQELQTHECESYGGVHGLRITARYYDSPGSR